LPNSKNKYASQCKEKVRLKTRQITVAFVNPIDKKQFAQILKQLYGPVTNGEGRAVNGIPEDWIIVENDERR